MNGPPHYRVCVVGPGTRFLSGLTYYTFGLVNALSEACDVSSVLLRQLLPTRLYPGYRRVGDPLTDLQMPPSVARFDGVDWYWIPSLIRAIRFIVDRRPHVLILQWWTGTVLHTYLFFALIARMLGIKIVVEFHETLDPGEDSLRWVAWYVNLVSPLLHRLASAFVVHSAYDRDLVAQRFGLADKPITIIPHATYNHFRRGERWREAPEGVCNILYLGLIRPYKGVEELVRAFDLIPPEEISRYWLTVVGETWESCEGPGELIRQSRYRDRISFVNRYVSDAEVDAIFGGADLVVLPYHRASQSGTLHIALNFGLPVVVSAVGGLVEAVEDYAGAILVEPAKPDELSAAIQRAAFTLNHNYESPRDWHSTAEAYMRLIELLSEETASRELDRRMDGVVNDGAYAGIPGYHTNTRSMARVEIDSETGTNGCGAVTSSVHTEHADG